jgi:hypothetical protein
MKMLHCTACNDVVALHGASRQCLCGKSHGQYQSDGRTVEFGGPARILGIRHKEFLTAVPGPDYVWFVIPEGANTRRKELGR